MRFIIDLTPPQADAAPAAGSARLLVLPARRLWMALAAVLLALAGAVGGAAYALAAYWVESGASIAQHLQAAHTARAQAEQTREWKAQLNALHADLGALHARVGALYGKGAVLSEHIGLPGERLFALPSAADAIAETTAGTETETSATAAEATATEDTTENFSRIDAHMQDLLPLMCAASEPDTSPPQTHALFSQYLQQQTQKVAVLERNFDTLQNQSVYNSVLANTVPMRRPVLGRNWRSSHYGYRKDPFTGRRAFHAGEDYAARRGTPIVAGADGIVSYAGRLGRYGKTVQINHGSGISTLYGHMYKIDVTPGQHVRKGEVIGSVGSSGRSTAPHLHYEVRVNNRPRSVRRTIKALQEERAVQQPAT